MAEIAEILERAQKLYNEGKWAETIALLDENLADGVEFKTKEEAEASKEHFDGKLSE